jgi:hypothetical protein
MPEYRVTKYDPRHRNAEGAYIRDEWTAFYQIGRKFGGVMLTAEAYQRVEDATVSVALAFLREAGCHPFIAQGVENAGGSNHAPDEGEPLSLDRLDDLLRRILREEFWCRLQGDNGFIHIGWDYYLYLGVEQECPEARRLAAERGLFVEACVSPYHPEPDQEDQTGAVPMSGQAQT